MIVSVLIESWISCLGIALVVGILALCIVRKVGWLSFIALLGFGSTGMVVLATLVALGWQHAVNLPEVPAMAVTSVFFLGSFLATLFGKKASSEQRTGIAINCLGYLSSLGLAYISFAILILVLNE